MAYPRHEFVFIAATLLAYHIGLSVQRCSDYEPKVYSLRDICDKRIHFEIEREIIVISQSNDSTVIAPSRCKAEFVMNRTTNYTCYQLHGPACLVIGFTHDNSTWTDSLCDNQMTDCRCLGTQSKSIYVTLSTEELESNRTILSFLSTSYPPEVSDTGESATTPNIIIDREQDSGNDGDGGTVMDAKYYFVLLVVLAAIILIFLLQVTRCRTSCKKLFEITQRRVAQLSRPSSSYDIPSITVAISEDYYVHRRDSTEIPSYGESQVTQEAMASGIFFTTRPTENNNNELILALPPPYPGPPAKDAPPPYVD
ncbi:hypothetical protein ScPMuIL_016085 [Solemya velum]